ncbi:MAG: glutamate synthase, partial [Chloroflexi bacterium]
MGIHFPSFSSHSVVYKVQGTVEILRRYYPELRDPDYASAVTLGHARYSTNTNPIFERAQPFSLIGHNGEFNTISRFRMEAKMLGIPLTPDGSDSQDVDRVLHALSMEFGLDLIEAMEYVFPPFEHDLIQGDADLRTLYDNIRHAFGPFAQGPAAVVARLGDLCVFSVDALGLRPLWFGETEKEYFASSERGVYPLDNMTKDPRPLAPGEKVALKINRGYDVEVFDYPAIQQHVLQRHRDSQTQRSSIARNWPQPARISDNPASSQSPTGNGYPSGGGTQAAPAPVALAIAEERLESERPKPFTPPWNATDTPINAATMAALGWERYHVSIVQTMAENGKEQIGSLGWDGPLAALSKTRVNIADYFKETVAVVTNPAIDREREHAQFSTRTVLGIRPAIGFATAENDLLVQLETPLIVGGHPALGDLELMRMVANQHGTMALEDLLDVFGERAATISMSALEDETIDAAIERIQAEAVAA